MIEFEKVVNGLSQYINKNIYVGMNDWQEIAARIAVSRVLDNEEKIKKFLMENGYVRTFGVMDDEGNIDIENLGKELKQAVELKEKVVVSVPFFGKMTFTSKDVDELYREITGGEIVK